MRALAIPLLVAACATQPRPAPQLTPLTANPSVPAAQALAICEPRAQLAAQRAKPAPSGPATIDCTRFGNATRCTETVDSGGFMGGFNAARAPHQAYQLTLSGCLAEYGWASR
jgi:hypothetical protein